MRVSFGAAIAVTATEYWLSQVRAGHAFSFGIGVAAVAAQNSHIQLFNPVGSGVNVVVRNLLASSDVVNQARIRLYNVALATDAGAGLNLLSGGAAGQAHVRWTNNAGLLGTELYNLDLAASTPFSPVPEWFTELGPGEGLLVAAGVVNTILRAGFAWVEV